MATAEEMLRNGQELSAYREALKIIMDLRDSTSPDGSNDDYFGSVILSSVEEYLIDQVAKARAVWRGGRTKEEYPACSVEEWEEYIDAEEQRRVRYNERMSKLMNDVKGGKYGDVGR